MRMLLQQQRSMLIRSRRLKPRQQRSDPMFLQEQNKNQGQNISALDPFYKAILDKSLILYTYEIPCELASFVDYPRSRIPQIFPNNKAFKNFLPRKVKKKTVFLNENGLFSGCGGRIRTNDLRVMASPRLAVPEKPFGHTLFLRFFDRCG